LMKVITSPLLHLICGILFPTFLWAQYSPPAGQHGTTAMNKDSSAFVGWASTCIIERGFINISDTTLMYTGSSKTTYGSYLYATGPADDLVVSLGDHGSALLGFDIPIINRTGPDFAVFENSFNDSFLELGFVEVSSDGERFVRFPTVSLTPETQQVNTFDTLDATKINNFAGKFRHFYGTPFDLDDIKNSLGIDLNNIVCIRIIDVIGCIQDSFATHDSQGHKVNDPWPTPFDTGGFDLDAVGVIHNKIAGFAEDQNLSPIFIYPNPFLDKLTIGNSRSTGCLLKITDIAGNVLFESEISRKAIFDLSDFRGGIYLAVFSFNDGTSITKKIIKY
jgi:hypothetical protein